MEVKSKKQSENKDDFPKNLSVMEWTALKLIQMN